MIRLTDTSGTALPTVFGTFNTDQNKTVAINLVQELGTFTGNVQYNVANMPFLMFTGDIKISGNTITRSDTGSFINDNFAPNEIIQIADVHKNVLGTFTIAAGGVADSTLTLTAPVPPAIANTYQGATISKMLDSLQRLNGTSWLDSGFIEGQVINIKGPGLGGATGLVEKIDLVTGTNPSKLDLLVLTDHPAAPGGAVPYSGRPLGPTIMSNGAAVVEMAARVTYTPPLIEKLSSTFAPNAGGDTITRASGNWVTDGFMAGQTITISGAGSDSGTYIIAAGGVSPTKLTLTATPTHLVAGTSLATITDRDTGNWYQQVTIPVIADQYFDIQPGHENLKAFPKVAHLLSGIRGPLAVDGGTTSADRSLFPAILLPGEANGPFFNIPPQPPETQSIDVLNIYNDGTRGNDTGTLTSTALTGFEMGSGLDFRSLIAKDPQGQSFGESGIFPGGISYGSISIDPQTHQFGTDLSHSTIESLNIMLGAGNDSLDVESTLIPGPDHNADGTVGLASEQGGVTAVHGGGNAPLQMTANDASSNAFTITTAGFPVGTGQLTRTDGLSWSVAGFAVGQQVLLRIDGGSTRSYTITAIGDLPHKKGSVLTLLAADGLALTPLTSVTGTITATDWLQVSSGQSIGGQVTGNFDVLSDRIVRDDNLPWASLGFAVGQQVSFSVGGIIGVRTVAGFDNTTNGLGSALILSGPALTSTTKTGVTGTVAVSNRFQVSAAQAGGFTVTASSITRVSGNWISDGFVNGQAVTVDGQAGLWTVSDVTSNVLQLQGADLTLLPAVQTVAIARLGGDNIVVNGSSHYANGNFTVTAPVAGDPQGTTDRITRIGTAWDADSFAAGQQVAITSEFTFPSVVFARNASGDTITRTSGNWSTDGFLAGQTIVVSGTTSNNGALTNNGSFTIAGVSTDGKTLILTAINAVVPTTTTVEPATFELTGEFLVTGFATSTTKNDTLLVGGAVLPRQASAGMTVDIDAPLVVYGDTTQDGIWYNGRPYQSSLVGQVQQQAAAAYGQYVGHADHAGGRAAESKCAGQRHVRNLRQFRRQRLRDDPAPRRRRLDQRLEQVRRQRVDHD